MNKYLLTLGVTAMLAMTSCGEGAGSTENASVEGEVTGAEAGENDDESTMLTPANVEKVTSMSFAEEAFEFGDITQGEKVDHTFKFTNTGENDLVIVSAKGSCGCTIPKWPKEPIAPGAEGEIYVVFNSEGKRGKQTKQVSIVANTEPATSTLRISGNVIAPEGDEAAAQPAQKTEG